MSLVAIDDLSDDELRAPQFRKPDLRPRQFRKRHSLIPAKGAVVKPNRVNPSTNRTHLANLIRRPCGCHCDCFHPFRSLMDDLVKVRKRMDAMTKLEKDQYVRNLLIDMSMNQFLKFCFEVHGPHLWNTSLICAKVFSVLKSQGQNPTRGSRHLRFLGNPVCNRAFMMLFAVGKMRFRNLNGAARRGDEFCPFDGRYIVRGNNNQPTEKYEKVHGFLQRLYLEAAEPIPDGQNSTKRPRHGSNKRDPKNLDRSEIKHLPHGSINDYWRQCVEALPELRISRKLFCTVS